MWWCCCLINLRRDFYFQMETIQRRQCGKEMLEGTIRRYQMVFTSIHVNNQESVIRTGWFRLVGVIMVTVWLSLRHSGTSDCREHLICFMLLCCFFWYDGVNNLRPKLLACLDVPLNTDCKAAASGYFTIDLTIEHLLSQSALRSNRWSFSEKMQD